MSESELHREPRYRVLLEDIMLYMMSRNLRNGKVWAGYEDLKIFFSGLRPDFKTWSSDQVGRVIHHVTPHAIGQNMTNILHNSGLVFETFNRGDEHYWHFKEGQQQEVIERAKRFTPENLESLEKVSERYGLYLQELGRA